MPEGTPLKENLLPGLESELRKLAGVWFPLSLDREHGGFLCDFNYRWRPSGPQHKMLEYQARQTIAAARTAVSFPDLPQLREAASHGFRFLSERIWDHDQGGWYRLLDRKGSPLEGAAKHGHGTSYAVSACVACYKLTGETACLELAKSAFAWLEQHAHDATHGGYFVYYRRDGLPILLPESGSRDSQNRDPIGTPIGFKDANTTTDILKSFSDLYRVWPDPLLRERLEELLSLLRDHLIVAPGVMHMYAHPDWSPVPDLVRYGQVLRSASQMLHASESLNGTVDPVTLGVATSMVDTTLRIAWDSQRGGFHFAGTSFEPTYLEGSLVLLPTKCWWAQADGLMLLLTMALLNPAGASEYVRHFTMLWAYIKTYLIDRKRGGWYASGLDTNPEARQRPKATMWKDASHETEALLDSLALLGRL